MSNKTTIWLIILVLAIGGGFWLINKPVTPGPLDSFAQCLKDKGALFYGAFWCPHCQTQKAMFGKSEKFLPYIECSTPNGQDQLSVCSEKNITGYPTWVFADGSRESGEVELARLAEKTGCVLPQ